MYLHKNKKKYVYKINYKNINLKGGTNIIPNYKIINLVPILYSFLDGKLNEDFGHSAELCLNFLSNNNLYDIKQGDILFNQFSILFDTIENIKELIKPPKKKYFWSDEPEKKEDISKYVENELISYFEIKNDLISSNFYFASTCDHTISFYIEKINDNHYNLVLINSGDGIGKYHDKDGNKFNLWKSYKFDDKKKFDEILNNILLLNLVVNLFSEKFKYDNFLLYHKEKSDLRKLIEDYYNSNDKHQFALDLYYSFLNGYENNNIDSNFFENKNLITFINNWNSEKEEKEENISSSSKSNNILLYENENYIKAFFKSNSFVIKDNNFFTEPQKSGSCSWFSVFWLIIANLIKKEDNPIEMIKQNLRNFMDILGNNLLKNDNTIFDYSLINLLSKENYFDYDIKKILEINKMMRINFSNFNQKNITNKNISSLEPSNYDYFMELLNLNNNNNFIFKKDPLLNQIYYNYFLIYNNFTVENPIKIIYNGNNYSINDDYIFVCFKYNENYQYSDDIYKLAVLDIKFKIDDYSNELILDNIVDKDKFDPNTYKFDDDDFLKNVGFMDNIVIFKNDKKFSKNSNLSKDLMLYYDYNTQFNKYFNFNRDVTKDIQYFNNNKHKLFAIYNYFIFYDTYNYIIPTINLSIKDIIKNNYKENYIKTSQFNLIHKDNQNDKYSFTNQYNNHNYFLSQNQYNFGKVYQLEIDQIIRIYYYYFNNIIFYESIIYSYDRYYELFFKIILYNPSIFYKLDKDLVNNIIFEKIKYIGFSSISRYTYKNNEHFFDIINLLLNDTSIKNHINVYNYETEDYTNYKNKDKKEIFYKLKEGDIDNLKNILNDCGSFEEMKEKISLNIDPNLVYKKYLNFVNKDQIIYNEDNYFKVNYIDKYFLMNFINTKKSPISCYQSNNKFILINDLIDVNKYFHDDYLIIFIELSDDGEISKLKFNDLEAILPKDKRIDQFPFLIFEPIISNSYILFKENTFYLLILANGNSCPEFEILSKSTTVESSVLLLEIGNNFIFPKFRKEKQIDMLKNIYCDFGCHEEVMYNFYSPNDEGLFRLKNYNVNEYFINNLDYCKSKYNHSFHDYDANLFSEEKSKILKILLENNVNEEIVNEDLNINITNDDLLKFINKHPSCKLKCDEIKKENLLNLFNDLKKYLIELRFNFSRDIFTHYQDNNLVGKGRERVNFNKSSDSNIKANILEKNIFEIIYNNYSNIYKIMQTNIFLNNIDRIRRIIEECDEDLSCKEIAEINSYLFVPKTIVRNEISFINLVFELLCGFIITEEQWGKFNLIYENYLNKDNQLRIVTQFMMGKGKSSVIMPLLLLNLQNKGDIVNIVVPHHLLNQTRNETVILKRLFNLQFNIFDDSEAKLKIIKNEINNNDLFIFDEFDMMFDPIQSNFNYISEKGEEFFYINHIETVINIIENKKVEKDHFSQEVINILKNNNIKNINYGMSKRNDKFRDGTFKRHVIPYDRKDTPNEGSSFISLLMTLVLTIKYFEENYYKFEKNDLSNMYIKGYILIEIDNDSYSEDYYVSKALEIQESIHINRRKGYVIDYLNNFVIKNLRYNDSIENCSFIDLMNSGSWATGFSGTVNIDLPDIEENVSKFSQEIIEDTDEKIGVYFALTGNYQNSRNNLYNYDNKDSILNILANKTYNCLIDIVALFKDYSNKDVILLILKIDRYKEFTGIYLDINDNIKTIDKDGIENDFVKLPEKDFIIFFSQRNIVGIDIPNQPNNMTGLAIINENERYTNVAQAIFRMRKLNKGQTIDIAYKNTNSQTTKIKIYHRLIQNDLISRENKLPYQQLQNLKFLIRNKKNNVKKYKQYFMKPLLIKKLENEKIDIKTIFLNQINWENEYKDNIIINTLFTKLINIDNLEEILFSGSQKEVEVEKEVDVEEQKEKEKEVEKEKEKERVVEEDILKNIIDNLQSIDIEKLLIFPNSSDNVEQLLNDTSELLELNQEYKLFMSIKCILQTNFVRDYYEKKNTISYYFVELEPNTLLLFPFTENIINENSPINYKFEYFKENDLNLYLRDFPVYNSFGVCINNSYVAKNKIPNLFYRYTDNNIFLILKKILNGKLLNNVELNIKNSKETLNNSIIFNIFVMILQKMQQYNFNFGFTKMKKKFDIEDYKNQITTKIIKNIEIYFHQIKNIREKIYFHYYNENLENINQSTSSSNVVSSRDNKDDKYIENLNDFNLENLLKNKEEIYKKKEELYKKKDYEKDSIYIYLSEDKKILHFLKKNEDRIFSKE